MDNYKIKVKDEAESKEAQELFVQLGYELFKSKRIGIVATEDNGTVYPDVIDNWDAYEGEELTLPRLRDLIVLKRNDVKDANYTYCGKPVLGLDTQDYKVWNNLDKCWATHLGSDTDLRNGLKPIVQPQDPALISGAEALDALKAKKEVEYCGEGINDSWLSAETLPVVYFLTDSFKFRLKPTILTVNAELPKPHKETQQNTEVYAVTYEFKTREDRNAFADKLRGTSS